jgi:hypothetical protein
MCIPDEQASKPGQGRASMSSFVDVLVALSISVVMG